MEIKEEDNSKYTIQPWESPEEYIEFYETLFANQNKSECNDNTNNILINEDNLEKFINSLSLENLKKSMYFLVKWEYRGDNKIFCLPIILLVDTIIKIKENKINNKEINSCHILAEVLIRVVNIIIDQLRKSKKTNSLNMYLVAKEINLPEFIIDIRHASTHKNLPSFNELIFAVEYMFLWVKIKSIEPKYKIYINQKKYFNLILNSLSKNIDIDENFIEDDNIKEVSLEPEYLMRIITKLFISIKNNFNYDKKKFYYDKKIVNFKISIFQKILINEKELFILLIFLFVIQQLEKINISTDEKNKIFIYNFCKIISDNIPKDIKFDLKKVDIFYLSVSNKINKLVEDNKKDKDIKNISIMFNNIFSKFNKKIKRDDDNYLNLAIAKNKKYVNLNIIKGNIIDYDNQINKNINENIEEENNENIINNEKDENNNDDYLDELLQNRNNYNSLVI